LGKKIHHLCASAEIWQKAESLSPPVFDLIQWDGTWSAETPFLQPDKKKGFFLLSRKTDNFPLYCADVPWFNFSSQLGPR
jgi:hypothetical protein